MKTAGWICLIIGVLSFLGAALKGNSVFGPSFWIALGAVLLYRAKNRELKQNEATNKSKLSDGQNHIDNFTTRSPQNIEVKQESNSEMQDLKDIQATLTIEQREAAMCLISFFGGFNDNLSDDIPMTIFRQATVFLGLPNSPIAISQMMSKFSDSDVLVDTVIAIKSTKVKEFLLLSCYDLIKSVDSPNAHEILYNIANDMGYDRTKMQNLIELYH